MFNAGNPGISQDRRKVTGAEITPSSTYEDQSMIIFKACVRCHGDIHLKEDEHGKFLDCLQCGAIRNVPRSIEIASLPDIA